MLRSDATPSDGLAFLFQIFDAKPHRGKQFQFRAAVRFEAADTPGAARLLVRVHRLNGSSCFFDNMSDRPIKSGAWTFYEISGKVCEEARDVELGMQLVGGGFARIDNIAITFTDPISTVPRKIVTIVSTKR